MIGAAWIGRFWNNEGHLRDTAALRMAEPCA